MVFANCAKMYANKWPLRHSHEDLEIGLKSCRTLHLIDGTKMTSKNNKDTFEVHPEKSGGKCSCILIFRRDVLFELEIFKLVDRSDNFLKNYNGMSCPQLTLSSSFFCLRKLVSLESARD